MVADSGLIPSDRQLFESELRAVTAEFRGAMNTFAAEMKGLFAQVQGIASDLKETANVTRQSQLTMERLSGSFISLGAYEVRHKELSAQFDEAVSDVNTRINNLDTKYDRRMTIQEDEQHKQDRRQSWLLGVVAALAFVVPITVELLIHTVRL